MNNIDFFNSFTLALLEHLYGKFPVPCEIISIDLAAKVIPETATESETFNLLAESHHTIMFLKQENYIEYSNLEYHTGNFTQVRLTSKGLIALNSILELSNSNETAISKIKKIIASGATEGAKEAASEIVKGLLSFTVGSISKHYAG